MKPRSFLLPTIALLLVFSSLLCKAIIPESSSPLIDLPMTVPALQATQVAAPETQLDMSLSKDLGSISGKLSYPGELIPPQRVVAFDQGTGKYYDIDSEKGQDTYIINNLPPGVYQVVAYLKEDRLVAGYSQAVPCGLSVDCNDHSLINVTVKAGENTAGVDPGDWYAPDGTFPPNPTK
jgi:hypothetical protein